VQILHAGDIVRARRRTWRIVDVGTGSGCMAIAIAKERPRALVTATDVSAAALAIARENAARLGVADRIAFVETPLLTGLDGPFDLLVSNLPYVPRGARPALSPDVRDYEPSVALFAGEDGLDVVHKLVAAARRALARFVPDGPGADADAAAWRTWHEQHEAALFFSDWGGYRWYVAP